MKSKKKPNTARRTPRKRSEGTIKIADAEERNELTVEELLEQGDKAYADGRYDEAIRGYTRVIEEMPGATSEEKGRALIDRALTFDKQEKWDDAIQDYTRVVEEMPDATAEQKPWALLNRATVFGEQEKWDEAIRDCTGVIEEMPDAPVELKAWALIYRGASFAEQGKQENEMRDYTRLIDEMPDAPVMQRAIALISRATNLGEQGVGKDAIRDYTRVIDEMPDVPTEQKAHAFMNRGYSWARLGDWNKSKDDFRSALELKPDSDSGLNILYDLVSHLDEPCQSTIKKHCLEIWIGPVDTIRSISTMGTETVTAVAHYTKLSVAEKLLASHESPMRYYNAIYMNDPDEGRVILDHCLLHDSKITAAYEEGKKEFAAGVYIGSFLEVKGKDAHEDELNLWRTYGKDENGTEAAGCSVVIKAGFFDKSSGYLMDQLPLSWTGAPIPLKRKADNPIYKVLYYNIHDVDSKDGQNQSKFTGDHGKKLDESIEELRKLLLKLIEDPCSQNGGAKSAVSKIAFTILLELGYFIKSADFQFEDELRVIRLVQTGADAIELDATGNAPSRLYVKSIKPVTPNIEKIILGPKANQPSRWTVLFSHLSKRLKLDIEVMRSRRHYQ